MSDRKNNSGQTNNSSLSATPDAPAAVPNAHAADIIRNFTLFYPPDVAKEALWQLLATSLNSNGADDWNGHERPDCYRDCFTDWRANWWKCCRACCPTPTTNDRYNDYKSMASPRAGFFAPHLLIRSDLLRVGLDLSESLPGGHAGLFVAL